jgi:two-component system, NarL family, nitrate/nitrite response regulator NarL
VDDHPMVRDMIRAGCEDRPGLDIVGEAGTEAGAIEAIERVRPDLVVLDLVLPGGDGFEVLREIRERHGGVRILVLSNRDDGEAVFESMRLGANGYLEKTTSLDALLDAMEAISRGEEVFTAAHEQLAHSHLSDLARRARVAAAAAAMLTPRELDVVQLVAVGLTTRQIASRLNVSPRTVETHIAKLYDKFGVRTRIQAIQRAAALGLVDLSASPSAFDHQ